MGLEIDMLQRRTTRPDEVQKQMVPRVAEEWQQNGRLGCKQVVETFQRPLFATFTMKNVEDLSGGAVRELRRAFGRFRRMKALAWSKAEWYPSR